MYHSLLVLSAKLTWPTAELAFVTDAKDVAKVPPVKSLPAATQILIFKDKALSLPKAPVVSAGKFTTFFSQVSALDIVYDWEQCLVLSLSTNSQI